MTDYDRYIPNLDACDIRLGTFPFGGANTNMDCFGLGIPFVILDGPEPHSHSDTAQLIQADMPDWLVANSLEEYILAALRLIEEDELRCQLSRQMMLLYNNDFFFGSQGLNNKTNSVGDSFTAANVAAGPEPNHH